MATMARADETPTGQPTARLLLAGRPAELAAPAAARIPAVVPMEPMPVAAPMDPTPAAAPMDPTPVAAPMDPTPAAAPMDPMPAVAPMDPMPVAPSETWPALIPRRGCEFYSRANQLRARWPRGARPG
jgi:hypothetical protein